MTTRVESYNEAIAKVKAAQPDIEKLKVLWRAVTADRFTAAVAARYPDIGLTPDQVNKIVDKEVAAFRDSLSEDQFNTHLQELHQQSVAAAVKQLEFERDTPGKEGQKAPEGEPDGNQVPNTIGTYAIAAAAWFVDRIVNNFNGAGNESGDGAKALKALTGISIDDIAKHGILGGENSYLRKIIPTWSDGGGVFGGDNSFFRKPFG